MVQSRLNSTVMTINDTLLHMNYCYSSVIPPLILGVFIVVSEAARFSLAQQFCYAEIIVGISISISDLEKVGSLKTGFTTGS